MSALKAFLLSTACVNAVLAVAEDKSFMVAAHVVLMWVGLFLGLVWEKPDE